jgi:hypothetical protein
MTTEPEEAETALIRQPPAGEPLAGEPLAGEPLAGEPSAKEPPPYDTGPEFQAFLAEIGLTKNGFARTLKRLGDHRDKDNIIRNLLRIAAGQNKISAEMRVIMTIMRNSHRKRAAAAAAKAQAPAGKHKAPHNAAAAQ